MGYKHKNVRGTTKHPISHVFVHRCDISQGNPATKKTIFENFRLFKFGRAFRCEGLNREVGGWPGACGWVHAGLALMVQTLLDAMGLAPTQMHGSGCCC